MPETLDRMQAVEQIDHILASEAPLLPTSGFAFSVMDSIRAEASEPVRNFASAINFPWSRLLPGAILAFALLAWFLWKFSASLLADLRSPLQLAQPITFQITPPLTTALWLLLALAASLLPLLLIRRMMGRSAPL